MHNPLDMPIDTETPFMHAERTTFAILMLPETLSGQYTYALQLECKSYTNEGSAFSECFDVMQALLQKPIPELTRGDLQIRLGLLLARAEYIDGISATTSAPTTLKEAIATGSSAVGVIHELQPTVRTHAVQESIQHLQSALDYHAAAAPRIRQDAILLARTGNAVTRLGIRRNSISHLKEAAELLSASLDSWSDLRALSKNQDGYIASSRILILGHLRASIRNSLQFVTEVADLW